MVRLLDLFCCAGGAGMGYHRAGFDVYGVDLNPQPRYPFPFRQGDALEVLAQLDAGEAVPFIDPTSGMTVWLSLDDFDAIHASPPCQLYTVAQNASKNHDAHLNLIPPVRDWLEAHSLPWVIENVPGSPLRNYVQLCGTEFHLRAPDTDGVMLALRRHRWFESSEFIWGAGGCQHSRRVITASVFGHGGGYKPADRVKRALSVANGGGGYVPHHDVCAALLGIDWPMKKRELSESIPPAYTEWIGRQLLAVIPARVDEAR